MAGVHCILSTKSSYSSPSKNRPVWSSSAFSLGVPLDVTHVFFSTAVLVVGNS